MNCDKYDIRNFTKASEVDTLFNSKNDTDRFVFIFTNELLLRTIYSTVTSESKLLWPYMWFARSIKGDNFK